MRKTNFIITGVLFGLIGLLFYEAWQIESRAKAAGVNEILGPGAYIGFLGFVLFIVTGIFLYQNILHASGREQCKRSSRPEVWKTLLIAGMMAGYTGFMSTLGFLLCNVVFFLIMFKAISGYSTVKSVTLAFVIGSMFYLIFIRVLDLPLPNGFLASE